MCSKVNYAVYFYVRNKAFIFILNENLWEGIIGVIPEEFYPIVVSNGDRNIKFIKMIMFNVMNELGSKLWEPKKKGDIQEFMWVIQLLMLHMQLKFLHQIPSLNKDLKRIHLLPLRHHHQALSLAPLTNRQLEQKQILATTRQIFLRSKNHRFLGPTWATRQRTQPTLPRFPRQISLALNTKTTLWTALSLLASKLGRHNTDGLTLLSHREPL